MITITLIDEINCHVGGLTEWQLDKLRSSMEYSVKGAFRMVAFQLKQWNGMESLMDEDGFTFSHYLDHIADVLDELRVGDVEIIDNRLPQPDLPSWEVPVDYIKDKIGFDYRDHQHQNINQAILARCGVLDAATNAGKTFVCASLAKYYQDYIPSLTIVPTKKLMRQTHKDYVAVGLDVVMIGEGTANNKSRLNKIKSHRHAIMTSSLLNNLVKYEADLPQEQRVITDNHFAVFYDELHRFGDTMVSAFRLALANCPVRIGMSGTVKKLDPLKKAKIIGCLGGDIIDKVSVKQLIENGFASVPTIRMVKTVHPEVEELCNDPALIKLGKWDWDREVKYYRNVSRITAIADYISAHRDGTNTLILCHPEVGKPLSTMLDCAMVDKDTPEKERDSLFLHFDESDDETFFCASFDTSGTGISQNNIHRLYLIDVRKNEVHILQGIGRGLRLDGKDNRLEVIDVYSNTYYAKKHASTRKNIYKRESLPFSEEKTPIKVD